MTDQQTSRCDVFDSGPLRCDSLGPALFTQGLIANELCVLHHWAPCSLSAASSFAFLPLRSGEMLNATPPKKPVYTGGESYLTHIGSARRPRVFLLQTHFLFPASR